jgi:hypothetical protein
MTYATYLRIYEPVSAFHEPDRSRWAAYAASAARPRRRDSLMVEHAEALRRAITAPQVVVPERESDHAYVRHADGITYVCPWQTRLCCLLASDDVLCGDQSVAEIRAAIDGAARGEYELAAAMYMRAHSRWRAFAEFELANLMPRGPPANTCRTVFPNLPRCDDKCR